MWLHRRTPFVLHILTDGMRAVCKDGRVFHLSWEPQHLRDLILSQVNMVSAGTPKPPKVLKRNVGKIKNLKCLILYRSPRKCLHVPGTIVEDTVILTNNLGRGGRVG